MRSACWAVASVEGGGEVGVSEGQKIVVVQDRAFTLDLLRAVSAQLVLLGHVRALVLKPQLDDVPNLFWQWVLRFSFFNHHAVVVFFVVSGFLVGGAVIRSIQASKFNFSDYAAKRVARLYSVLVPGLILSAIVAAVSFNFGDGAAVIEKNSPWYPAWWSASESSSLGAFACNMAFMQTLHCLQFANNLSLWSLSNEFIYYVAFPCLLIFMRASHRISARLFSAGILLFIIAQMFFSRIPDSGSRNWIYVIGFLAWACGAYAEKWGHFLSAHSVKAIASVLLLIAAAFIYRSSVQFRIEFSVSIIVTVILMSVSGIDDIAKGGGRQARKIIAMAADYSFSLYVIHVPLIFLWLSLDPARLAGIGRSFSDALTYFSLIVIINASAFIFYLLFERHHRLVYRLISSFMSANARNRAKPNSEGGRS